MTPYFAVLEVNKDYLICNIKNKTLFIAKYEYTACYYGDIIIRFKFNNNYIDLGYEENIEEDIAIYPDYWINHTLIQDLIKLSGYVLLD